MLYDDIYKDYIVAFKARDKAKSDFLSFIRAELKNAAIELRKESLSDEETLKVLKRQKKRLEEAREAVVSSRSDAAASLDKEIALLESYLPQPLEESQLRAVIDQVISELGASSIKDMGRVMKEVMTKVGASADARQVSTLVKEKLSP